MALAAAPALGGGGVPTRAPRAAAAARGAAPSPSRSARRATAAALLCAGFAARRSLGRRAAPPRSWRALARRGAAGSGGGAAADVEWLRIPPLVHREVCEVPDLRPGAGELREGSVLTLPVLPLRRVPLPLSEHRLPASQPEQRRLYDDLLQSGKRDFVGALSYGGRLARIGVLLHLQELSELPGMPGPGRPLWVGRLGAAGRVRLLCAQNPEAWFGRSSYLRATVELLDGAGEAAAAPAAGAQATAAAAATRAEEEGCPELRALRGSLHQVRALQARLREEAQLRPCRWEEQGIWAVCDAWREFAEARLRRQCRRQLERVVERWGERCPDGYRTVRQGRGSYPVGVSQEMGRLRDAFAARRAELGLLLQRVLEGPDLRSQAQAMRAIVEHEHKRLLAKKALAGIAEQ